MAGAGDFGMLIIAGVVVVGGIFLFQNPQILSQFAPQPAQMEPPAEEEPEPAEEPPEEEGPPPEEEYQQEPEVQVEYIDRPVPYPVPVAQFEPGLSRRAICSRYYGGSCNRECKEYGFGSRICRECISFCGPPRMEEYPRPRHRVDYEPPRRPRYPAPRPRPRPRPRPPEYPKPRPRPFPRPGKECPRGQRYNWAKKKCEVVPPLPKTSPEPKPVPGPEDKPKTVPEEMEPPMSTSPDAGEPEESGQPPANAESNYASYYSGWY